MSRSRRTAGMVFAVATAAGCARPAEDQPAAARRHVLALAEAAVGYGRRQRMPPLFPMSSSAEWTPRGRACDLPRHLFPADAAAWAGSPWSDLGFALAGPSAYQYRVTRTGSASRESFFIEAQGDRDCDGVTSHFAIGVTAKLEATPLQVEREDE